MKLRTLLILVTLALTVIVVFPIQNAKAETLVWTGDVSSLGTTTTGPVLTNGWQYRIEVSEIWYWNWPANLAADAMYYVTYNPPSWTWHPAPDGHSFLQINEMDVDWGPRQPYPYVYSIPYVGDGTAIRFRIVDWVDQDYTNNYCHLPVSIYLTGGYDYETAYGLYSSGAFKGFTTDLGLRNWGWTNYLPGYGTYEFELWAGAAMEDLSKGTFAGYVTLTYSASGLSWEVLMVDGCVLEDTHVYAGIDQLPKLRGSTVSPGRFSIDLPGDGSPIWVIWHGVVGVPFVA